MKRKIIVLVIILIFSVSFASAENNTSETADLSSYILPVSITDNGIEFSDGFTGFVIDDSKDEITADDGFIQSSTGSSELENYIKLAIIECYKQNRESEIGKIIQEFVDGSYTNSDDKVIENVLKSDEKVSDEYIVNLSEETEGTFDFELLNSVSENKSDCLAYKVSLAEIIPDEPLSSAADEKLETEDTNTTQNDEKLETEDTNTTQNDEKTEDTKVENEDTNTTQNDEKTEDTKVENEDTNTTQNDEKTDENNKNTSDGETIVNETNKTIITKTNTKIVNVNNTTIVNEKNVKTINKTNETPENNTLEKTLLKTAGNPIFILIVVIVLILIAVAIRRKD